MYDHVMQVLAGRTLKPTILNTAIRDTHPQSIRFLEKRGYQQVMRWINSELALKRFIPGKFMPILDKVRQQGINIVTVAQLRQSDPDWQQKLYDLDWECSLDEPQPDEPTREPLEQYIKHHFEAPNFWPEAWFIAMDGEQYVAMAQLFKNEDDARKLDSGFTAVLRSHRRRGIAMALKVAAINFALRRQIKSIKTGNEENNPMYQINLRLGFEPLWSELAFEKRLAADGEA
jgi:GNAT superfamily N-acetyltransferase